MDVAVGGAAANLPVWTSRDGGCRFSSVRGAGSGAALCPVRMLARLGSVRWPIPSEKAEIALRTGGETCCNGKAKHVVRLGKGWML